MASERCPRAACPAVTRVHRVCRSLAWPPEAVAREAEERVRAATGQAWVLAQVAVGEAVQALAQAARGLAQAQA